MRRLASFVDHARELNTVAWSCTNLLASCAEDGQVIVRDADRDCAILEVLSIPDATHCAWSPDGQRLAVGTQAGRVEIWEPLAQEHERTLEAGQHPVVMVAWATDGTRLACASKHGRLVLWDPGTWARYELRGHGTDVVAVSFSADGRLLASKSRDHTVVLWRTDGRWPVALIRAQATPAGWCVGLAFHPRERVLAGAGDEDDVVRLWNLDRELCAVGRGVLTGHRPAMVEPDLFPGVIGLRAGEPRRVVLV